MMSGVVVAPSANLALLHRNYVILSNAEIGYIVDCKHRDRAFQSLWGWGAAGSGLDLLEIQFSSSGETDRRGRAVLFLI